MISILINISIILLLICYIVKIKKEFSNHYLYKIIYEESSYLKYIISNNRLLIISPACESLTGYSQEEFINNPDLLNKIIHSEYLDKYKNYQLEASSSDEIELKIVTKNNCTKWILYNSHPIHAENHLIGLCGTYKDITEKKAMENKKIKAMQLEYLQKFSGAVAHDFNNILMSIMTFAYLLRENNEESQHSEYLQHLDTACRLGKSLTANLLTFGKRQTAQFKQIDINDIILGLKELLINLTERNDIKLHLDLEGDHCNIFCDPNHIEQVFINICLNSRDSMQEGGTFYITTKKITLRENKEGRFSTIPPGEYITVSICDTGIGIDNSNIEKIFDPFFSTKTSKNGFGLGLPVVDIIMKEHNAFIDIDSTINNGSIFLLYFRYN